MPRSSPPYGTQAQPETPFFIMRRLATATDSSPAPLRLSLEPASGRINVGFAKRQAPVRYEPLSLPMQVGRVRSSQPHRQPAADNVIAQSLSTPFAIHAN